MTRLLLSTAAFAMMVSAAPLGAAEEKLNVLGTDIVIKVDGKATNGALAVVEATVKPGDGPPRHVHSKEDETFYVLEGQFRVWHGDHMMEAGPGTTVFMLRNNQHTYENSGTGPGRLLVTITPAGFEGFFREVSKRGLSAPKDMQQLDAVAKEYGLQFVGPPPAK